MMTGDAPHDQSASVESVSPPGEVEPTPDAGLPSRDAPEYLVLGQVVAPFGVRGEMKVNIMTEFPDRFAQMESVVLAPFASMEEASSNVLNPRTVRRRQARPGSPSPTEPTPFPIESTRIHKGQLLLKVAGIDSVDDIEALRGYWVLVPREQAKKLPKGSYYLYELNGLEVYTTEGTYIGWIADVLTMASNDVYIVRGPGVTEATGELLVPAIRQVVKRVEMKRGRVIIAPTEEWM